MKRMKLALLLALPLLAAGVYHHPAPAPARARLATEGESFAQVTCAACHAIAKTGSSPRSNAPPFPVIVNQEGLTEATLSEWLRGAHNYPREMDFYLRDPEVRALVAYMLTLRDPHYQRPPDW
jgi:mono/diheme cytochrome c family protein